jgi:hypothetical protein
VTSRDCTVGGGGNKGGCNAPNSTSGTNGTW